MKIDIVYTWVNGTDPRWQERKEKRLKELGIPVPRTANHSCRFVEHDELRYSLRSIYSFAPWINKIYIITDNQVPVWFNPDNAWVRIVDHKEIFDDHNCLPTYNASALETKLHKIPGLSEYYLYFNDDLFLGRKCDPDDFIRNTKPCIYIETNNMFISQKKFKKHELKESKRNEFQAGMRNSRKLISDTYGKETKMVLSHGIRVYRKSIMNQLNKTYNEHFEYTSRNPFRTFNDILSYAVYSFYLLVTKKGKPVSTPEIRSNKYFFHNFFNRYRKYLYKYVVLDSKNLTTALANIKKYKHFMFCLNDGHDTTDEDYEKVQQFLKEFFPDKSPAEK